MLFSKEPLAQRFKLHNRQQDKFKPLEEPHKPTGALIDAKKILPLHSRFQFHHAFLQRSGHLSFFTCSSHEAGQFNQPIEELQRKISHRVKDYL
jgi:hypothetical protein